MSRVWEAGVEGGVLIIIALDFKTYEKALKVARERGFLNVANLIQSYVDEWIEADLSYIKE